MQSRRREQFCAAQICERALDIRPRGILRENRADDDFERAAVLGPPVLRAEMREQARVDCFELPVHRKIDAAMPGHGDAEILTVSPCPRVSVSSRLGYFADDAQAQRFGVARVANRSVEIVQNERERDPGEERERDANRNVELLA